MRIEMLILTASDWSALHRLFVGEETKELSQVSSPRDALLRRLYLDLALLAASDYGDHHPHHPHHRADGSKEFMNY